MAKKEKEQEEIVPSFVVLQQFRDADDFNKIYSVGQDVSDTFDKERMDSLIAKGLVKDNGAPETGGAE